MPKAEHQRGRSMALYETILKLKDLDECCRFFDDLCTPTEPVSYTHLTLPTTTLV